MKNEFTCPWFPSRNGGPKIQTQGFSHQSCVPNQPNCLRYERTAVTNGAWRSPGGHWGAFRVWHQIPELSLEDELEPDGHKGVSSACGWGAAWTWELLELGWVLGGCMDQAPGGVAKSQGVLSSHFGDLDHAWQVQSVQRISFMFLKYPFIWREEAVLSLLTGNKIQTRESHLQKS